MTIMLHAPQHFEGSIDIIRRRDAYFPRQYSVSRILSLREIFPYDLRHEAAARGVLF